MRYLLQLNVCVNTFYQLIRSLFFKPIHLHAFGVFLLSFLVVFLLPLHLNSNNRQLFRWHSACIELLSHRCQRSSNSKPFMQKYSVDLLFLGIVIDRFAQLSLCVFSIIIILVILLYSVSQNTGRTALDIPIKKEEENKRFRKNIVVFLLYDATIYVSFLKAKKMIGLPNFSSPHDWSSTASCTRNGLAFMFMWDFLLIRSFPSAIYFMPLHSRRIYKFLMNSFMWYDMQTFGLCSFEMDFRAANKRCIWSSKNCSCS